MLEPSKCYTKNIFIMPLEALFTKYKLNTYEGRKEEREGKSKGVRNEGRKEMKRRKKEKKILKC